MELNQQQLLLQQLHKHPVLTTEVTVKLFPLSTATSIELSKTDVQSLAENAQLVSIKCNCK